MRPSHPLFSLPSHPASIQESPSIKPSLSNSCINWSNVWTQAVAGSGLGDRVDAMPQPSDPNGLSGATVPNSVLVNMQQTLAGMGVLVSATDLAAWSTISFQDAVTANSDMGDLLPP